MIENSVGENGEKQGLRTKREDVPGKVRNLSKRVFVWNLIEF